jgi:hypothetical protein
VRIDVSVLYVDPRGPYPKLVADWWDEKRDARLYAGPNPVVAHPPCGPYSSLRTLSRETTADCGPLAVAAVQRWGGVLEQPSGSKLWEVCGLPAPFVVDQVDFGHVARKRTWLYLVGCTPGPLPPKRKATHWCSGSQTPGARGKPPPGIKICSAQQRRRTPVAFAEWLLDLAAQADGIFCGNS